MAILNKIKDKLQKSKKPKKETGQLKDAKSKTKTKKIKKIKRDNASTDAKKNKTIKTKAPDADKSIKKQEKEKGTKINSLNAGIYSDILAKVRITEKSTDLAGQNKYTFDISPNANKRTVQSAIKAIFGVRPEKINIIKTKGKRVRFGRIAGKRKNTKKAIVTLKKGDKLDIYEGL